MIAENTGLPFNLTHMQFRIQPAFYLSIHRAQVKPFIQSACIFQVLYSQMDNFMLLYRVWQMFEIYECLNGILMAHLYKKIV